MFDDVMECLVCEIPTVVEDGGKTRRCPNCGKRLIVPGGVSEPDAAKASESEDSGAGSSEDSEQ